MMFFPHTDVDDSSVIDDEAEPGVPSRPSTPPPLPPSSQLSITSHLVPTTPSLTHTSSSLASSRVHHSVSVLSSPSSLPGTPTALSSRQRQHRKPGTRGTPKVSYCLKHISFKVITDVYFVALYTWAYGIVIEIITLVCMCIIRAWKLCFIIVSVTVHEKYMLRWLELSVLFFIGGPQAEDDRFLLYPNNEVDPKGAQCWTRKCFCSCCHCWWNQNFKTRKGRWDILSTDQ